MKNKIRENGIVAIMRGVPLEQIADVAEALYRGGVRVLECTFEQNTANPLEVYKEKFSKLKECVGDKMILGAGTVITESQAELVSKLGGSFIVTPNLDDEVLLKAKSLGLITLIGALTPSEIAKAHKLGADFVKIFPTNCFGPSYVKAVKAPLSHIDVLAVGGVSVDTMKDFVDAGCIGFGISSPLMPAKAIANKDYATIENLARSYVETFKSCMNK